jgi:hypothetical protein
LLARGTRRYAAFVFMSKTIMSARRPLILHWVCGGPGTR